LYQVTYITLDFVLFKGGWYILILFVGTRFFDVLQFGFFDAEEDSLKTAFETDSDY